MLLLPLNQGGCAKMNVERGERDRKLLGRAWQWWQSNPDGLCGCTAAEAWRPHRWRRSMEEYPGRRRSGVPFSLYLGRVVALEPSSTEVEARVQRLRVVGRGHAAAISDGPDVSSVISRFAVCAMFVRHAQDPGMFSVLIL